MKQKLWTTLIMYLAYCIVKVLWEGRMRCKMSNYTLLERPALIIAIKGIIKAGDIEMKLVRSYP